MARRSTSTSAFGVSKRESHDSSGFYRRFAPPELSTDLEICPEKAIDKVFEGDSRRMGEVPDASVALVVTSPPYFAGKEYEAALGQGGVPGDYLEFLDLLRDVLAECVRKLEPGGRLAVNVANLGRRPYRSLSADVIAILQDDLRLLLRGEILWAKQRGSSGSCAWGTFAKAANPVLRDVTERVIVASKGRFDRALSTRERQRLGLPWRSTIERDDFLEETLDVWEIPPESATRIGHPAPFPVELPARLIELYTYEGDLVLDPFLGAGSTAVAAWRSGRHYAGYDLDGRYVELTEARLAQEKSAPADPTPGDRPEPEDLLHAAGFHSIERGVRVQAGLEMAFRALDRCGGVWLFDLAGPDSRFRPGLRRSDHLWRALGKAAIVSGPGRPPLVLLTPGRPPAGSPAARALSEATGPGRPVRAIIDMDRDSAVLRLGELQPGD